MARLRSGGLVLLFVTAMTLVQATTLFKDKNYMRQVPRQLGVGQGASTSTFNYWWPYPAWTATATTSPPAFTTAGMVTTALLPVPTTLNPTSTLQNGVLASLSVPSPDSSSSFTFSGALATLSDTSTTSLPTSFPSSSSASASSPVSSSSPTAPGFPSRGFFTSPHFLIPLIAAVSTTVVLSLLLWLKCRHRRRARTASSSFSTLGKGGWRVVEESYDHRQRRGWWSGLFRGRNDEWEETVPGPKYVGVEEDPEGPTELEYAEKEDVRRWLDADGEEQGGRLDIASWAAQAGSGGGPVPKRGGSGSRYSRKRGGSTSAGQPLLSSSFAPAPAAAVFPNDLSDEEGDDGFEDDDEDKPEMRVPWESLRHKSIKRAILAKVDEEKRWTDSMRGVRAARAVQAVVGGAEKTDVSPSRTRQGRNEGFRIVVESPPVRIPTPSPSGSGRSPPWSLASAFPFPLFSSGDRQRAGGGGGGGEEDKYTPIPPSPSRSSPHQDRRLYRLQRQKQVQGEEPSPNRGRRQAYRPSPSVLRMQSPPSVMTPQMESALCFTPVVGASARMEDEGMVYTETCRDRTDRAIRRVETIVESAWSDRERG